MSGATWAVALDISKAFDRVWHAGLLHQLMSYWILCQIFGLILSFLSNRQLRVVLDGKSSQEYPFNSGVTQCLILCFTLFLLYIKKTKKLHGPFLWMGINCLKARATSRRQFTFYHLVPRYSWHSFYRPRKDERLTWPWSHPVVLSTVAPSRS